MNGLSVLPAGGAFFPVGRWRGGVFGSWERRILLSFCAPRVAAAAEVEGFVLSTSVALMFGEEINNLFPHRRTSFASLIKITWAANRKREKR